MLLKSISRISGYFTKTRISKWMIRRYVSRYQVNVDEAEKKLEDYRSLNDFFTRRLKKGVRVIDPSPEHIISPVDGLITEFGNIDNNTLIQAKGKTYDLDTLLGQDPLRIKQFEGGEYITFYLSPQHYHRIHSPYDGEIDGMTYIPGSLYPVNRFGTSYVPGLYRRNERIITYLQTPAGQIAVVKVGAFLIGSVQLLYEHPELKRNRQKIYIYQTRHPAVQKGDELGYFQFGSTVICLFEKDRVQFTSTIKNNPAIQMGQKIGTLKK
ncbi:MAG: phosphatidylserine decarboxylase [Bacillaceae bacterium]|nr:phosphatidylserine decarboxylase [Bacillaceae bacterium]